VSVDLFPNACSFFVCTPANSNIRFQSPINHIAAISPLRSLHLAPIRHAETQIHHTNPITSLRQEGQGE
jgi:hypothetical protein